MAINDNGFKNIKLGRDESLSSPDILAIVKELVVVENCFIDNLYQDDDKIGLRIRCKGAKYFLVLQPSVRANFTEVAYDWKATNFIMMIRKHLKGRKIERVRQHEFDRIIEIEVEGGYKIITELFRRGNFIVVKENRVLFALRHVHMRDRAIYPGAEFKYPPGSPKDPRRLTLDEFKSVIMQGKNLLKGLLKLGLGRKYAYEALFIARMNPESMVDNVSDDELKGLFEIVKNLLDEIENHKLGIIYMLDGKPYIVSPIQLKIAGFLNLSKKRYENFSKAVDDFFIWLEKEKPETDVLRELSNEREKLIRRIRSQERSIRSFEKKISQLEKILDVIYGKYSLIESILSIIRHAKLEKGLSWDEIRAKIEEGRKKGITSASKIERISDDGTITIRLNSEKISINFKESLENYISRIYERIKKLRTKKRRAEEELEKVREELRNLEERIKRKLEEEKIVIKLPPRKWYHGFNWFISSDGFLVVGGKDRKSNEILVKRYMDDQDIFLHAEIHGGSVVIIKNPEGKNIPETTLKEAAELAASYSKAWKEGITAVDVYWTPAKKVSFTPPSGQYLPKGGFIVEEKNYIKNVPLKIAIGVLVKQTDNAFEIQFVSGPVEVVKKLTKYCVVIAPGYMKKFDVAKRIIEIIKSKAEENPVLLKALHSLKIEKIIELIPGPSILLEEDV